MQNNICITYEQELSAMLQSGLSAQFLTRHGITPQGAAVLTKRLHAMCLDTEVQGYLCCYRGSTLPRRPDIDGPINPTRFLYLLCAFYRTEPLLRHIQLSRLMSYMYVNGAFPFCTYYADRKAMYHIGMQWKERILANFAQKLAQKNF